MNPRLIGLEMKTKGEILIPTGPNAGVYVEKEMLGSSESGAVYLYENKTDSKKSFAVKQIYNRALYESPEAYKEYGESYETYLKKCFTEQQLTQEMVGFCDSCVFNKEVYIIMPEVKNVVDFCELVRDAKEDNDKLAMAISALKAVDDMHKKNITHGDLSRNILASRTTKKIHIIDFGFPSKQHDKRTPEMEEQIQEDKRAAIYYIFSSLINEFSSPKINEWVRRERDKMLDGKNPKYLHALRISDIVNSLKDLMINPKEETSSHMKLFDKKKQELDVKLTKKDKPRRDSLP